MSDSESYNGWRNVETWRVQLHLTNDEGEAGHVRRAAHAHIGSPLAASICAEVGEPVPANIEGESFADYLRDYVTGQAIEDPCRDTWVQFRSDVVGAALQRVDWQQIAACWLEAARVQIVIETMAAK